MANMSILSGIPPSVLDLYNIWQIADHIMVNLPNGLPITDWEEENKQTIMYLNDLTFYINLITTEMAQLVSGEFLKFKV